MGVTRGSLGLGNPLDLRSLSLARFSYCPTEEISGAAIVIWGMTGGTYPVIACGVIVLRGDAQATFPGNFSGTSTNEPNCILNYLGHYLPRT